MNSGGSWISKLVLVLFAIQLLPGALKVAKTYYSSITVPKTKVGVVTISGEIREGGRTVYEIKSLLEMDDIKALVLKIDSGGGAPGASQAMYYALKSLGKKHGKPIIAWVENMAASGAYYVAVAADYIVCTPSALVGSVGVYMSWPSLKDFIEQFKARYPIIKSGKYKAATYAFGEMTPEQREMFEAMMHEIHTCFIDDVLAARGAKLAASDRALWAEGQPVNGQTAFTLGLVDEIGSILTVEEVVKRLAAITTELEWVKPAKKSPLAKLLGGEDSDEDYPYVTAFVNRLVGALGLHTMGSVARM